MTAVADTVRYRLTPQMADYDRLFDRAATRWLPFVMFFQPAEFRSRTVNTDRIGFRHAIHDGRSCSLGAYLPDGKLNLLVGGSTAMGLGATCDGATIPSQLAAIDRVGRPWLNLGGRGFTSTQELVLYLLHGETIAPRIDHIVLLSGLNNLVLTGMATGPQPRDYGLFFFSDDYRAAMAASNRAYRGHRGTVAALLDRVRGIVLGAGAGVDSGPPRTLDERIALAAALVRRDLAAWAILARAHGARLSYCLQPLASWAKDRYSPEEMELFAALDTHPANASAVVRAIEPREVGERYARALRDCARALRVPFWDLNAMIRERDPGATWTFVDRAHLTDGGYRLVAELLAHDIVSCDAPRPGERTDRGYITHVFDE